MARGVSNLTSLVWLMRVSLRIGSFVDLGLEVCLTSPSHRPGISCLLCSGLSVGFSFPTRLCPEISFVFFIMQVGGPSARIVAHWLPLSSGGFLDVFVVLPSGPHSSYTPGAIHLRLVGRSALPFGGVDEAAHPRSLARLRPAPPKALPSEAGDASDHCELVSHLDNDKHLHPYRMHSEDLVNMGFCRKLAFGKPISPNLERFSFPSCQSYMAQGRWQKVCQRWALVVPTLPEPIPSSSAGVRASAHCSWASLWARGVFYLTFHACWCACRCAFVAEPVSGFEDV